MKRANSTASDLDFLRTLSRYLFRWVIFIWERFNPPTHLVMIVLFTMGTATLADVTDPMAIINGSILATIFFLRLRLFDEIKDYETDITINPKRPLPRGLLNIFDLKIALIALLICEAFLVISVMPQALNMWAIATAWSLLMYKEFFIANLIRPYLTTYATSHTLVTLPLTLALITGMTGETKIETRDLWAAIGAWLIFNIFELGRKTFQASEEREGVESYSRIWGRFGAVALVLGHAALAAYAFIKAGDYPNITNTMYLCSSFLVITGALYLFIVKPWSGVLWRVASSVFIILVYGALALLPYVR